MVLLAEILRTSLLNLDAGPLSKNDSSRITPMSAHPYFHRLLGSRSRSADGRCGCRERPVGRSVWWSFRERRSSLQSRSRFASSGVDAQGFHRQWNDQIIQIQRSQRPRVQSGRIKSESQYEKPSQAETRFGGRVQNDVFTFSCSTSRMLNLGKNLPNGRI